MTAINNRLPFSDRGCFGWVLNCHACGSLPYADRGKFGWLCGACWELVCRILKREP